MTANKAKELFQSLLADYFDGCMVIFANQSRTPKPEIPLVTILPGNVKRPQAANSIVVNGVVVGFYLSTMSMTIDLFTRGKPVEDEYGEIVAYENSALDEMLALADYLNSPKCVEWCSKNDVSIMIDTDAQDLTGLINDNNYEYRAQLEVQFSFTQKTAIRNGYIGYFESADVQEAESLKNGGN